MITGILALLGVIIGVATTLLINSKNRKDIEDTINKVNLFQDKLKLYYHFAKRDNLTKADEIYKEIENEFSQIMTLTKRIEDSLNPYYEIMVS